MLRIVSILTALLLLLSGCTVTPELQKARRINQHRTVSYLPESGPMYRLPPFEQPSQENPRAMPDFTALSYSPFKAEPDLVRVEKGRMMKAASRRAKDSGPAVSYSPLTGEAVLVPSR